MLGSAQYPQLSKAPITMAILELRYVAEDGITDEGLRDVKNVLKDDFPTHNLTTDTQFEFKPDQHKTSLQLKNSRVSGNIFFNASRSKEIQLSTRSYNFKQHGSYSSWSEFCDSALTSWDKCKLFVKPKSISWLSLRYINNIEIPLKDNLSVPAEGLFNTYISNVGKNQKQAISAYSLRYTHFDEEKKLTIHFAQELLPGPTGILPFIIDIDVIHRDEYKPSEIDVRAKFEELRNVKNSYFFDNLTKSTLDLIK